jgi:hypothetical protein
MLISAQSVRMKRNWDLMDRELKKSGGQYWCADKFTGGALIPLRCFGLRQPSRHHDVLRPRFQLVLSKCSAQY